jgi:tetratricopeptide (TPR) repeat protein
MRSAENAAMKAIALDPNWALGFSALGLAVEQQGRLTEANELYDEALRLAPNDPDVLHLYSRLLAKVGYLEDAWTMRERLRVIDPHVDVYNSVSAFVLWLMGRDEEAIAMARDLPALHRDYTLSRILASIGDFTGAANVIESDSEGLYRQGIVDEAVRLLRAAPDPIATASSPRLGLLAFVYLYAGLPERALEPHEDGVDIGYSVAIFNAFLWHRSYRELRGTERFRTFLRNSGIIDYWEEFGWPEFCSPVENADDFSCQ